jgi:GWxTD domain-containing protein
MHTIRRAFLAALAAGMFVPAAWAADKLDKDDKAWLDSVAPLIQTDERDIFKKISKRDRAEFQAIFWARRNPSGPAAATNEFRARYEAGLVEVEKRLRIAGRAGATSDCGRVFLLLGPPVSVKALPADAAGVPSNDQAAALRAMGRTPELWLYKDSESSSVKGGQVEILFDEACMFPQAAQSRNNSIRDQLSKLAAGHIVTPQIKPEVDAQERLVPLAELLKRQRTPVQVLFAEPRQDFPFEYQQKLAVRVPNGTYVAGLVRVPATGLTVKEQGGKKRVALFVATQVVGENGKLVAATAAEHERVAEVDAEGNVLVSYTATTVAGTYTLRLAVLDGASGKGSVQEAPLFVADLTSPGLKVGQLQLLSAFEPVATPDPKDALVDFLMGNTRLVPRFGNVFKKSESLNLIGIGYGAAIDPATGKAAVTAHFEISLGARKLTSSQPARYDVETFSPVVGPVPLQGMEPGTYTVKFTAIDGVAKQEETRSTTFEVVP